MDLAIYGTKFQQNVWITLLDIPYGQTRSYKDIARSIGNINAARAVGAAIAHNPVAVYVPCHRVIKSNGAMHNYAWGCDLKRKLLRSEGLKI